jgi:hypothetical protein
MPRVSEASRPSASFHMVQLASNPCATQALQPELIRRELTIGKHDNQGTAECARDMCNAGARVRSWPSTRR